MIKIENRVRNESIAVVAITEASCDKALQIFEHFPNSRLFIPSNNYYQGQKGIYRYNNNLREILNIIFNSYSGIIILGSVGIAVRFLAPFINDKLSDPGVVVVDQEGKYAVNLLSGHLGGGNELAKEVGKAISAHPIITTASDLQEKSTPDSLAFHWNMSIEGLNSTRSDSQPKSKKLLKQINSEIVRGNPVTWMIDDRITIDQEFNPITFQKWSGDFEELWVQHKNLDSNGSVFTILITDRLFTEEQLSQIADSVLILRPKNITIGIGCKQGTSFEDILEFIQNVLTEQGISHECIREIVSIDKKSSEPGLIEAARYLQVPLLFYGPDELSKFVDSAYSSKFVNQKVGVGGVCEPAVMIRCGRKNLIQTKTINDKTNTTLALGRVGWPQWASVPEEE